jgi:hypothetical protein
MKQAKNRTVKIRFRRRPKDPMQAAAEYGIDIPMLMANLAGTPEERIRRHQIALDTCWMLRNSKRVEQ